MNDKITQFQVSLFALVVLGAFRDWSVLDFLFGVFVVASLYVVPFVWPTIRDIIRIKLNKIRNKA